MDEPQDRLLADMGPVYYETETAHAGHLIVEPFNAFSSLAMSLAALMILIILVRKDFRDFPFLSYVFSPLIFIGGIGSTLFHAFRTSQFFLLMDWLPILLLTILLALYYWYKVYPRWYFIVIMVFAILLMRMLPVMFLKGSAAINLSYFISGLVIIVPILLFTARNRFVHWKPLALSVVALLFALFFRYTDDFESLILPMGTHWLWHIFSGIGAWFLGVYIYRTSDFEIDDFKPGRLSLHESGR